MTCCLSLIDFPEYLLSIHSCLLSRSNQVLDCLEGPYTLVRGSQLYLTLVTLSLT